MRAEADLFFTVALMDCGGKDGKSLEYVLQCLSRELD